MIYKQLVTCFYLLPLVLTNGFKEQPKDYWGLQPLFI